MIPRTWLLLSLASLLATGCNSDLVPVSGRVTFDGKPLADAVVVFQPQGTRAEPLPGGTGSVGRTDKNGHFSLRLVEPDRIGAIIGEHIVTISALRGGSDAAPAKGERLPKAWQDGSKKFKVPAGGTAKADFEIRSK